MSSLLMPGMFLKLIILVISPPNNQTIKKTMNKPSKDTGTIARSAGKVSIAVMCSRILGLVREQAFAVLFGAGFAYDAFVVAFRIPNLLRDLFGEGALSAAFVTVFSEYESKEDTRETWRLAGNVLVFITILLSVITLTGILFAKPLITLMVDADFEQITGKMELTRQLTVIMFPFLIFISLSSVVMGILNTKGRFFIPALASSFFNLGSIVGGVSLSLILPRFGYPAIVGMAIGTLIGGFLQLAGQLPSLFKTGFIFLPRLDLKNPGLKRIIRLMAPAIIGLAALQINIFINTYFASSQTEGSLSWLNYAFRLFQLPVGVFGVALSVATLPLLSRHAAAKDMNSLQETFTSSLTMAFCLAIPASAGLIFLAEPIIRIIFEHGIFSSHDTIKTAEALTFYAMGLTAYSAVKIMVPVFYALDDTRYPVIGSFLAVGVNIIVILLTINTLHHKAMALSISVAMTVNFLFLGTILHRKLQGFSLTYLLTGLSKVLLATLIMLGALILLQTGLNTLLEPGFIQELIKVILLVISGATLYGFVLYMLKLKELSFITEKITARIKGNSSSP